MKTEIDSHRAGNTQQLPLAGLSVHAAMVLVSSAVLSMVFVIIGAGTQSLLIPMSAALLIFVRLRPMVLALTLVPIALIREATYGSPWPNDLWFALDPWWICVPSLFLIICTFRFQTVASGVFPRRNGSRRSRFWPLVRSSGFRADDVLLLGQEAEPIEIGKTAGLALVAFALSSFLLVNLATHRDWVVYSGLLPAGLRVVQLTLGTCLVFLVAYCLCCYARWKQTNPEAASAFANRELWKWNRGELRIASRKRMRLRKKDQKRTSRKDT